MCCGEAGAEVDVVDAYRNVMPEDAPEQLRSALAAGIDAATFTSSSSATHLADSSAEIPRDQNLQFKHGDIRSYDSGLRQTPNTILTDH